MQTLSALSRSRCARLPFLLYFSSFSKTHGLPVLRLFGSSPDSGDWDAGLAARWGALQAIEDVGEHDLGFEIEVTWKDDGCSRQGAVKNLIQGAMAMGSEPFHAVLGSGCSAACVGLAELSPIWYIPVLSWGCASPGLSDTETYPYFARTEQNGGRHALGFVMVMKVMGWQHIGCLTLSEDGLFYVEVQNWLTAYINDNSESLGIELVGPYFFEEDDSDTELTDVALTLAESGTRVVAIQAYEGDVARYLCVFKQAGLVGSHWVFMSFAWFSSGWLTSSVASTSCTTAELLYTGTNMLLTASGTWTLNETIRTIGGQEPQRVKEAYYAYIAENTTLAVTDYTALMYDAVWTAALAMQSLLQLNPTALDNAPDSQFLENFTTLIQSQDFFGVSGRVHFDSAGDRIGSVEIRQLDASDEMVLKGSCTMSECIFIDTIDFGLSEPWNPDEPLLLEGRVPSDTSLECPDGSLLNVTSNTCEACPDGKTLLQISDTKSCACDAGTNISADDSQYCSACPPGRYAATVGIAGSCSACPAGSYSAESGATGCTGCPAGTWQSEQGSSACNSCSDSQHTQVLGADSQDLCLCQPGTILVPGSNNTCATCSEGMDCTSWNTTVPLALEGYMLWDLGAGAAPGLPGVFHCSVSSNRCPGGGVGACADGRHGLLCEECLEGLESKSDGTCGQCTATGTAIACIFLFCLLVLLIILYACNTRRRLLGGEYAFFVATFVSVVLTFCQTLAVLDMLAVKWGSPLDVVLEVMRFFLFDEDIVHFGCVASMSQVMAYTMWVVLLPLMILFLCLLGAMHSLLTQKWEYAPVLSSVGSLFSLAFISYVALVLSIYQCEGHPSDVLTVRSRGSVVCWTTDEHLHLVFVGGIFLLWPLAFFSASARAVRQLPEQLAQGNVDFLRQWEFLFGRFRNGCQWYCLVIFLRGLFLSLVSVFTNAAVQIIVMQLILIVSHIVTCTERPWRSRNTDLLDRVLISPSLIMTMVVAPFFVDDSETDIEFVAWMPFVALVCCVFSALVLAAVQLVLFIKRRQQHPYHFFQGSSDRSDQVLPPPCQLA